MVARESTLGEAAAMLTRKLITELLQQAAAVSAAKGCGQGNPLMTADEVEAWLDNLVAYETLCLPVSR